MRLRRPVRHEDLADHVLLGHDAPHARVARLRAVVAHDEVVSPRDAGTSPPGRCRGGPARCTAPRAACRRCRRTRRRGAAGSATRSPGSPMIRLTNVPPAPHFAFAAGGVSKTTTSPRSRIAEVVDEAVREHAIGESRLAARRPGRAQWSVGSIDDDGIRYGLTTQALIARTIAIAPTIVTIQSTAIRSRRGSAR